MLPLHYAKWNIIAAPYCLIRLTPDYQIFTDFFFPILFYLVYSYLDSNLRRIEQLLTAANILY